MPDVYVAPKKKKKKKSRVSVKSRSASVGKKEVDPGVDLKQTNNPLASFVAKPKDIRFETQEKKEKILLLLRRHWLTNIPWMLIASLMVFAPRLLRIIPIFDFLPARFLTITLIAWYMFVIAFVLEKSLSWLFNVNIITDERVVDIDFPSMLYRDISSTKIDQTQDVTVRVGGFIRSLLNYGDVQIQTAGAELEICFEDIPNPGQVAKLLNDLVLEEEQEKIEGRVR